MIARNGGVRDGWIEDMLCTRQGRGRRAALTRSTGPTHPPSPHTRAAGRARLRKMKAEQAAKGGAATATAKPVEKSPHAKEVRTGQFERAWHLPEQRISLIRAANAPT